MAFVITKLCTLAGDCIDTCPVEAISKGETQSYIDPDTCIECGACAGVCPVEAIFAEDDVPAEHKDAIKANAAFFS